MGHKGITKLISIILKMYYCDEQLTHYNGIVILLSGLVSSSVVADAIVILFVILVCMYPNSDNSSSNNSNNTKNLSIRVLVVIIIIFIR